MIKIKQTLKIHKNALRRLRPHKALIRSLRAYTGLKHQVEISRRS